MTILSLLVVCMWVLFGTVTAFCAHHRGRDPYAWFAVGMLFQLIGLVILFLLPDLTKEPVAIKIGEESEDLGDWHFIDTVGQFHFKEWYYVNADLVQHGPLNFDELQKIWGDGNMSRQTFVWSEGMPTWKKINELPGFETVLREISVVNIEA